MIVFNVGQLIEASDGSVPEAFKGQLTQLYPQKKVGADNNLMQKGKLSGGGHSIEIVFMGREDMMEFKGAEIYVTAKKGTRGLMGTKRKDNEYQGKVTPQIWVYEAADIACEEGSGGGDTQETQEPAQRQPAQRPAASSQQRQPAQNQRPASNARPAQGSTQRPANGAADPKTAVDKIRLDLLRMANLMILCLDAATYVEDVYDEENPEMQMTGEQFQGITTTFFIQAARDGALAKMPTKNIRELAPKREKAAAQQ